MPGKFRNQNQIPAVVAQLVQLKLERAVALHQGGQLTQAESLYEEILKVQPKHFDSLHFLGVIAYQRKQYRLAVDLIGKAIKIFPGNAAAHSHLGNALQELKQLDAAVASHDRAIAIAPAYAEAHSNRGNALQALRRLDAAVASFDRAIALRPDYAGAHYNRGNALLELGRPDAAAASFDRAIALRPDYAEAHYNRGNALQGLQRLDAAVASYDRAIAIKPDFVSAYWNKSLAQLLGGDYAKGWEFYEWRWKNNRIRLKQQDFLQPLWLGKEPLADKTILLHDEQGFGDTIQFCRYAKPVNELGAKVILQVQRPLHRLLRNLEGIEGLVSEGDALPEFDYHTPLMSLPLALKTRLDTIPAPIPYLHSAMEDVAYWTARLGPKTRPRVGLVWSGGFFPNQPELWAVNERRNIPLRKIVHLDLPGIDFYSLQKGDPAESELIAVRQEVWPGTNFFNYAADLKDFSDTAALIQNLDLVISVDTSTAHLAGALGKPVWLLNRFDTCWRWLLDRTDSPWYPTVTLYRQERMGDWDTVIERVRADLARNFPTTSP